TPPCFWSPRTPDRRDATRVPMCNRRARRAQEALARRAVIDSPPLKCRLAYADRNRHDVNRTFGFGAWSDRFPGGDGGNAQRLGGHDALGSAIDMGGSQGLAALARADDRCAPIVAVLPGEDARSL